MSGEALMMTPTGAELRLKEVTEERDFLRIQVDRLTATLGVVLGSQAPSAPPGFPVPGDGHTGGVGAPQEPRFLDAHQAGGG